MKILGQILVILIILAIVGGIFSLAIFLLPFILGLAGVGFVVVGTLFILYLIFQIVRALFMKKSSENNSEQSDDEVIDEGISNTEDV